MLARFRANPEKVRVSIQRVEGGWFASVELRSRSNPGGCIKTGTFDPDPERAVMISLGRADGHMPGIDLDMQWSYEHPQRPYTDEDPSVRFRDKKES